MRIVVEAEDLVDAKERVCDSVGCHLEAETLYEVRTIPSRKKDKPIGRIRLRNIIRKLLEDDMYTNHSPRITRAEMDLVKSTLGVELQIEHTHGAQAGPIAVYPLEEKKFKRRANQFLEAEN